VAAELVAERGEQFLAERSSAPCRRVSERRVNSAIVITGIDDIFVDCVLYRPAAFANPRRSRGFA